MDDEIIVERRNTIATVTLNRPTQRNAISYHAWLELQRITQKLDTDTEIRVVVFTGSGDDAFSAGADIKDFDRNRADSAKAKVYAEAFDGALEAIDHLSKPTISLIKGFCVGGGCELALATDIRIAADNSQFGIPIARLGILLGYREMQRLANLVGSGNATYLLLSGRLIDAQSALRIGLIHNVVILDDIRDVTYDLASEMAALAPLSHKHNKQILRTILSNPSLAGLTPTEKDLPFTNFDSEDFQEGYAAFLEHRTPVFRGK